MWNAWHRYSFSYTMLGRNSCWIGVYSEPGLPLGIYGGNDALRQSLVESDVIVFLGNSEESKSTKKRQTDIPTISIHHTRTILIRIIGMRTQYIQHIDFSWFCEQKSNKENHRNYRSPRRKPWKIKIYTRKRIQKYVIYDSEHFFHRQFSKLTTDFVLLSWKMASPPGRNSRMKSEEVHHFRHIKIVERMIFLG